MNYYRMSYGNINFSLYHTPLIIRYNSAEEMKVIKVIMIHIQQISAKQKKCCNFLNGDEASCRRVVNKFLIVFISKCCVVCGGPSTKEIIAHFSFVAANFPKRKNLKESKLNNEDNFSRAIINREKSRRHLIKMCPVITFIVSLLDSIDNNFNYNSLIVICSLPYRVWSAHF